MSLKERRCTWLQLQGREGGEIFKIHTRFFKENPETWLSHFEETRKRLNSLWYSFEQRHFRIVKEPLYQNTPYINKKCYEITRSYYEELEDRFSALEKQKIIADAGGSMEESVKAALMEHSQVNEETKIIFDEMDQLPVEESIDVEISDRSLAMDEVTACIEFAKSAELTSAESGSACDELKQLFVAFETAHRAAIRVATDCTRAPMREEFFALKLQVNRVCALLKLKQDTSAEPPVNAPVNVHQIDDADSGDEAVSQAAHVPHTIAPSNQSTPRFVHAGSTLSLENPDTQTILTNVIAGVFDKLNGTSIRQPQPRQDLKLNRISLPKFSGTKAGREEWGNFFDLFQTLVHLRTDLSDSTKMSYLKTSVTGDAAAKISHFPNNGENYDSAWKLLIERYHNPRLLIMSQLGKLFKLKPVTVDSSSQLAKLVDSFKGILQCLGNLKEPVDSWNSMLVYLITQKVPIETLSRWEQSCDDSRSIPSLESILSFLERRISALEAVEDRSSARTERVAQVNVTTTQPKSQPGTPKLVCVVCKDPHSIYKCPTFEKTTIDERERIVRHNKLCTICLKSHSVDQCSSSFTCTRAGCDQKHSSFLHRDSVQSNHYKTFDSTSAALPTARLRLSGANGESLTIKCLLDQGAMRSFVSERVVQVLNLPRKYSSLLVAGVGDRKEKVKGWTALTLSSVFNIKKKFEFNFLIMNKLTTTESFVKIDHYSGWKLADPVYFKGGQVDMIIGSDYFRELLMNGLHQGAMLAQKTHLGWILSGPKLCTRPKRKPVVACNTISQLQEDPAEDEELSNTIRRLCDTEDDKVDVSQESAAKLPEEHTVHNKEDRSVHSSPLRSSSELGRSTHNVLAVFNDPSMWTNRLSDTWDKDQLELIQTEQLKDQVVCVTITTGDEWITSIMERFSDWRKATKVWAFVLRFISRTRGRLQARTTYITAKEVSNAELHILKCHQAVEFGEELKRIRNKERLAKTSPLQSAVAFIDNFGLLRLVGRLANAVLPYDQRHPIILPAKGHLSNLIILAVHHQTLHGGTDVTLNESRKKYWIINGRQRVRAILTRCIICRKSRPRPMNQLMGQLPAPRVNFTKAFLHSGCDFAGPIYLKSEFGRKGRTYKAYIAIFVCLSTKAFHLELVGSLTTDAFIAALKRFKARRSTVETLYSDNGTNFVGAFKKLQSVSEKLVDLNIEWNFIPPASPHFGGLWEAGVKSCKTHLSRILGSKSCTWEEMETMLCSIEASMNSRPLCPLSDDVNNSIDGEIPYIPKEPRRSIKFMEVNISGDNVLFYFRLPIVSPHSFNLYRPIVTPVLHGTMMTSVIPQVDHIAVSGDEIRSVDLLNCPSQDNDWICDVTPPDLDVRRTACCNAIWKKLPWSNHCKTVLAPAGDVINYISDHVWSFTLANPTKLDNETLTGSGIYSRGPLLIYNDTLKADEVEIYIPRISDWAAEERTTIGPDDVTGDILDLKDSVAHMKQIVIPGLSHPYGLVTMGLSGSAFVIILVFVLCTLRVRRNKRKDPVRAYLDEFDLK